MTVMLVQYTDTDQLVERLKKGKYVSADRVREERRREFFHRFTMSALFNPTSATIAR